MNKNFVSQYAYVHARPTTVSAKGIFYVGKGNERRSKSIIRDNFHHRNIVKKYGKENILVGRISCSSSDIAFELEKGLIKCLKRMGVELTNVQSGGEGGAGMLGDLNPAKRPEVRTKISNSIKKLPAISLQTRLKIAKANTGKVHAWRAELNRKNVGWKHTEEAKAKIASARKGKSFLHTLESIDKIRVAHIGRVWLINPVTKETKNVTQPQTFELLAAGWKKGRKIK